MNSPQDNADEQVVRGVVARITFRNPSNGYSVIQLDVAEQNAPLTVVGNCLTASVGAHLLVRGVFTQHPKFGRQLAARVVTETAPSTPQGIATYLSSGLIPGVGEKTAERLVHEFGAQTLDIIFKNPEKVARVPGIGRRKAELICSALSEHSSMRGIMQFLLEHKISPKLATKIFERYRNRAPEVLAQDPYVLARDVKGVGFLTADNIARNLGLKPEAPQRLKAGIYFALERAADDGHCFLPVNHLFDKARALLQVGEEIDLSGHLEGLVRDDYLVCEGEAIYLSKLYRAEKYVAGFISERAKIEDESSIPPGDIEGSLTQAAKELGVTFSPEQRQAVLDATCHKLMVITGGPGCGKTTIIRALTTVFGQAGKRLLLAAPTGRAAQRMAQVTGLQASTIHRLLKYDPVRGGFFHGPSDPLLADVIIIDESSMIDISLAQDLFSAIPKNATLVLVGDRDQLPSVGPGRVFADLIASRGPKIVALQRLFRRSEQSTINSIAHMINSGSVPDIPQPDGTTKVDAYFIPRSDPDEALDTIEKLVADQVPRKFGISAQDICVLTPSNRGPLGTETLNKRLQDKLNPCPDRERRLVVGNTEFRVGDRVCQRVNNYQLDDLGVFNGDVGYVYSVEPEARSLVVEMWDGRLIKYEGSDVHQLSLAYAITVHRSQGSEIPCVVLALHDSQYTLLERQLLYTGVTRAKKLLLVVGSKRALTIASKRATTKKRMSKLVERISVEP
ncbi:MAG: ATP-dependent RecD-like DNA helicase [Oligoflexia bacterium]|nr:ATP-dependent RecD-like DNA helicase [Oligoflexia bacterium]